MAPITEGDKLPEVELDTGFPPEKVNMLEHSKGKKMIIIGLPGAFTPTWSTRQVPGYLEAEDALKKAGVDEVAIYCVNDGAVMKAWGKDQKIENTIVKFYADPTSAFTRAVDMELTHNGPIGLGLLGRCKRFALYVVDGEVKFQAIAEDPEFDPAGDEFPEDTLAPALLEAIKELEH